jgi:probable phosphoglycerate mutase
MTGATLVLSRHGETVWHRENRYAGISDVDLTELGNRQARALAEWCRHRRPAGIYCSPVRRAIETAQPSVAALGTTATIVPDLREVDFGVAEGRTLAELVAESSSVVDGFRRDPVAHPLPGGESFAAAADRGSAALQSIAATSGGECVLVVAHNTLLRLTLCRLLDVPVTRYRDIFPRLDNGALSTITLPTAGGRASLVSLNVPLPLD